ncbi:MAG: M24 family metallopeptidase, partial [Streptosporangiaceae bacterium]
EPGMTERQVAVLLERNMIDLGADGIAFDSIVASGPNGAVPHHEPGGRALADGDLITMDFGAVVGGYHADMTRTVALGQISGWQQEIYDLTRQAQQAGIEACVPDADVAAADAAARDLIRAAGYGDCFPHGLGHGVGLEIHEAPLLGDDKTGKLRDRVPVTAEPGVYLAGRGGVRIEDTLVVRADGPELLTQTTKELLVL